MGLFTNWKKKNAELKREIIKELESVNSSSVDMNKNINALEEMVNEHVIIGNKDEFKILQELLGRVAKAKSSINSGKDSAARTAITEARDVISEKWATSAYVDKEEKATSQSDLDNARDELTKALARRQELYNILVAHPEKKAYYASEWNNLDKKIKILQQNIARFTKEQEQEQTAKDVQEQIKLQQTIEKRSSVSNEKLMRDAAKLKAMNEEQAKRDEAFTEVGADLYGTSGSGLELAGFDTMGSSDGMQLAGFDQMGAPGMGVSAPAQNQDSATIQQARKKVEENLAKLESATEDLKDQLADKDREYNKLADQARQLIAKRHNLSAAEYKTIDYKIDELKVKMLSLNKEMASFQNVLQQNNLKIALLRQLKTENDLDIVTKYGVNLSSANMEEISAYLYGKGEEKNADLANLDALTSGTLTADVNSITNTGGMSVDASELDGDADKYADFEAMLQRG